MPKWSSKAQRIVARTRSPLILLGVLVVFSALQGVGVVPSTGQISEAIQHLLERHGLILVAVVSFFENLVGLNVYFPGSVVMLTVMAFTAGDPARAVIIFLFIFVPSLLAHQVNFFLGRGMGSKSDLVHTLPERRTPKGSLWIWFFTTAWHPHFAAVTSMAAGSSGMSYRRFATMFGLTFFVWDVFWAIAMYNFGFLMKDIQESNLLLPLFIAYTIAWLLWSLWRAVIEESKGV